MFTNEFHLAVQIYEFNLIVVTGALDKTALLLLRRVSLCVGAKANVPFAGGNKNFNFFERGQKIKIRSRGLSVKRVSNSVRKSS